MIAIIDYDAGNMKSVEKALQFLEADVMVTRDKNAILAADQVILPGVGAFGEAMEKLESYGLIDVIHQVVAKGTPFLGICLGMQLLFDQSEESGGVKGLGLLRGEIVKIPSKEGLKIPHIGWNSLKFPHKSVLFDGISEDSYVYFVHSYYLKANDMAVVAATTTYGVEIHAAVEHNNIYGCQFHPEKSSEIGLNILKNFVSLGEEK